MHKISFHLLVFCLCDQQKFKNNFPKFDWCSALNNVRLCKDGFLQTHQ